MNEFEKYQGEVLLSFRYIEMLFLNRIYIFQHLVFSSENPHGFNLQSIFSAAGPDLIELIKGMLMFDPLKRITSTQALQMPYFE